MADKGQNMELNLELGQRVKELREALNLSRKDLVLASGDNRHSGSGEKRQFWSTENSHLQFE